MLPKGARRTTLCGGAIEFALHTVYDIPKIQNKDFVREATKGIKGLGKVNVSKGKVVEL